MNITIYTVGRLKEDFYRQAAAEYIKRLGRYCRINIVEVPDEKAPETLSARERSMVLKKEGERLSGKIKDGTYLIALAIDGQKMDSEQFAGRIRELALFGKSEIGFCIGGSNGLSEEILKAADLRLSFSDMTFPHQLMRVILLEQIYRAFKINSGEPYHK